MKIIYIFLLSTSLFLLNSCQTIEKKSEMAIKKENEKLSKFLQQPESELKIVMGEPDKIIYPFFKKIRGSYNTKTVKDL